MLLLAPAWLAIACSLLVLLLARARLGHWPEPTRPDPLDASGIRFGDPGPGTVAPLLHGFLGMLLLASALALPWAALEWIALSARSLLVRPRPRLPLGFLAFAATALAAGAALVVAATHDRLGPAGVSIGWLLD